MLGQLRAVGIQARTRTTGQRFSGFSANVASPKACCWKSTSDMIVSPCLLLDPLLQSDCPRAFAAAYVGALSCFRTNADAVGDCSSPRSMEALPRAEVAAWTVPANGVFTPELWQRRGMSPFFGVCPNPGPGYPSSNRGPSSIRMTRPCNNLIHCLGYLGNGMNPSLFGIATFGSDCASMTSFGPMIPLRLRI